MNKAGRRLIKLTDLIIVFVIVLISLFIIFLNTRHTDNPVAVVTVNNKEIQRIDLKSAKDEILTLDTNPMVTLEIKNSKIRFTNAMCPDKTCEKCGFLENAGDTAACVPANTVITIQGTASPDELDAVAG